MTIESSRLSQAARLPGPPQPSQEQEERLARRRGFNRIFVYLPLGLGVILWLGLILGMAWLSVAGDWFAMDTNQPYFRGLLSGVADAFTILMLTPILALCAIPTLLAGAFTVYRRRRRKEKEGQEPSLPLMWRIENVVISIRETVSEAAPKVVRPLVTAHGMATFTRTFLHELKQIILQEIDKDVDDR